MYLLKHANRAVKLHGDVLDYDGHSWNQHIALRKKCQVTKQQDPVPRGQWKVKNKLVPVGVVRGVVEAVQFVMAWFVVIFGINTSSTTKEISAIWLA